MKKRSLKLILLVVLSVSCIAGYSQSKNSPGLIVDANGGIQYTVDDQGNRIPDFSFCGYQAMEAPIPDVPVKVVVPTVDGDATSRIQRAIDYVASLPVDANGFRGAVLLERGTHVVHGSLLIRTSGVVLRGAGFGKDGTVLIGAGVTRETLIRIVGSNDRMNAASIRIESPYVAVNSFGVTIGAQHGLKAGDFVTIQRASSKAWIDLMGMNEFGGEETQWLGWKPGQRDVYWDRKVLSVTGNSITLDAPITTALEDGTGLITKYQWPGRIEKVGVENINLQSTYDNSKPMDEDHRWMAITMENTRDAWVRRVTFEYFAGSAVALFETASRVTIEDCISTNPVSEIGGQRRYTFFNQGQQNLFHRIYSEQGYHDFAIGFCAAGPNAFVQCATKDSYGFSGTIDSWASGVLFDNVSVDGQSLGFTNRMQEGHGAGWTAANSVLWQCSAARINCFQPPSAWNWSFGSWGEFSGNGIWRESNNHVKPASLFWTQVMQRLSDKAGEHAHLLPRETEASSSPSVAQAALLSKAAQSPAMTLDRWIIQAPSRKQITPTAKGVKSIDEFPKSNEKIESTPAQPVLLKNGILTVNGMALSGKRWDVAWWRGDIRPYDIVRSRPHITRFVPGRVGTGFTDDLTEVSDQMVRGRVVAMEYNYGLWYDRRRDDHERVQRMDGDVWPPFYEMPFARSGKEKAFDGLSRYDLTKFNPWYWNRLNAFASQADQKGLLLIYKHYFQHNILEAGGHWTDFFWRSANNINDTGFPEPPPYAGDKRIFMAEQFYDITNPVRRKIHRDYIRKCLDNFKENSNVIQIIGAEYTGPLHFVQFWLDVIIEWEKENQKNVLVALSTTRDVQDEILKDPVRSAAVDVIDIRYWHYEESGKAYAPEGGQNLAPRQHARLLKPKTTSFDQVYRAVSEYKSSFPDKAVMYSSDKGDEYAWAAFMAGGSVTAVPAVMDAQFTKEAVSMKPAINANSTQQWVLEGSTGYIIYLRQNNLEVNMLKLNSGVTIHLINPSDGRITKSVKKIAPDKIQDLVKNATTPQVIWLSFK